MAVHALGGPPAASTEAAPNGELTFCLQLLAVVQVGGAVVQVGAIVGSPKTTIGATKLGGADDPRPGPIVTRGAIPSIDCLWVI